MGFSLGSLQRLAALQILLLQFFHTLKRNLQSRLFSVLSFTTACFRILLTHLWVSRLQKLWTVNIKRGRPLASSQWSLDSWHCSDFWSLLNTKGNYEAHIHVWKNFTHAYNWMGNQCIRVIQNAYLWKRLEGTFFFKCTQKEERRGGWLPFIVWCWTTVLVFIQK